MKLSVLATSNWNGVAHDRSVQAAEIKAFFTGAAHRSLEAIIPQFERESGHKVAALYELPPALVKRVDAGEPFDVLILSYDVEGADQAGQARGRLADRAGPHRHRRRHSQGAPKPDFGSVEKFKRMLLGAKSFATSGEGSAAATSTA